MLDMKCSNLHNPARSLELFRERFKMRPILSAALMLCTAASSFAAVYDVQADFSNSDNPNGTWGYMVGNSFLLHSNSPNPNALNPVLTNGFWGTSPDYNSSIMQATGNGSGASGYTDSDFLAGDVLVHSTNPGTGDPSRIVWTAPEAGEIDYDFSIWYAHSPITRSNTYMLKLNGTPLETGVLLPIDNRPNAHTYSDTDISVLAGDILEIEIVPTIGQNFGSLAGVGFVVDFTGIPEPTTLSVLAAGAVVCLRRRRA